MVLSQEDHTYTMFERFYDHLPISLMVVTEHGNIMYQNQSCEQLLRLQLGQSLYSMVGQEDRLKLEMLVETAIENQHDNQVTIRLMPAYRQPHIVQVKGVRCPESARCVIFTISLAAETRMTEYHNSSLEDPKFDIEGTKKPLFDMSSMRAMEVELKETKELFESFIENTSDTISIVDMQGKILKVNRAFEEVHGWKKEEIIGRPLSEILGVYTPEHEFLAGEIKRGVIVNNYETVRYRKDGTPIDISITIGPVRNNEGEIIAMSAITRDITERKQTEELLRKSDQLAVIGQLAAGVAHEIRNPLTSLKGFIQLLKEMSNKQAYFDIMLDELNRIEFITNEFLTLAKPQVKVFKRKEITKIINNVVAIAEIQGIVTNVKIETRFEKPLPFVYCEENLLKQVFLNIIKNAIESMNDGGTVTIFAECNQEYVHIMFKDEGSGIPPERLKHIGEPFYSTKEKGTGLGLMVSNKIIKEHQGSLKVESEAGKGTVVTISLPVRGK
ncbi:MAG TPA: PAS domain S-box protein [Bacillus sp. (in: firmicutes)]|nr:PAS domain S-box protein [Bacillus sp. (in: firmicutes)]